MKKLIPIIICLLIFLPLFAFSKGEKPSEISNTNFGEADKPVAMFLSDCHIGENFGAVTRQIPPGQETNYDSVYSDITSSYIYYHVDISQMMKELDKQSEPIPYLIIVGDIFDLAVDEISDAFNLSHAFFNTKINGKTFNSYFEKIICIPGNHDHHLWRMLQEEYYVQNRLHEQKPALHFPHQIVAALNLANKKPKLECEEDIITSNPKDNFISYIMSNKTKPTYIVYPNLYIKYNNDNGICVTHGHFFEENWNKTSPIIPPFNLDTNYFVKVEKYNSPFTEFSDFSVAQARDTYTKALTDAPFKDPSKESTQKYLKYGKYLAEHYPEFFPLDTTATALTDIEKLERDSSLVSVYLQSSRSQMKQYDMDLDKLVYGHTHVPCFKQKSPVYPGITISNTGGWVNINTDDSKKIENSILKKPNPVYLYKDGTLKMVLYE